MIKHTFKERQLATQVLHARNEAEASCSNLINQARINWDYYMAKRPEVPFDTSSKVTDRTVWNHVEGAVSQVLPIFLSMENKAIKFTPLNMNDVDTSAALTHYVSEKILFKNDGKKVLENAIREAFINRISWVKTSWGLRREASQVSFTDISTKQLRQLEKEYDEVIVTDDDTEGRKKTYSGVAIEYKEVEDLRIENVPLENMLFPAAARNNDEVYYIGQVSEMLRGELVDMFGEEIVREVGQGQGHDPAQDYAMSNFDGDTELVNSNVSDDALERYKLTEHYIYTSLLNDGKSLQWVQVFTINDQMVEYNVVKGHPFEPIVAVTVPNSITGYSFAELLADIQTQRSAIMRASMSNALNMAYPRYQAVIDGYDVESLVNNVPGGVIEVETIGNVQQFTESPIPSDVYNLFEMLNIEAQRITGVSDMVQGLDPNVLKGTNAAATVIAQMNAGTKRVLGYGKAIAEGWRKVMLKAYDVIRENSNTIDITYLGGKQYVLFDKKFQERKLEVAPVFGQDANLEKAQLLMSLADRYGANPALQKSYNPYALEQMILDSLGVEERHAILTDPAEIPPSEEEIYQMEYSRRQQDLALQQLYSSVQMLQTQIQQISAGIANDSARVSLEHMKIVGDQEKSAEDIQTDRMKIQIDAQNAGINELKISQDGQVSAAEVNLKQNELQLRQVELQLKQAIEMNKLQLEQAKLMSSQEIAVEQLVNDRTRVELDIRKAGVEEQDFVQRGEIEATKLNIQVAEIEHKAMMDVLKAQQLETEIAMEYDQRRAVKFGE